MEMPNGSDIRNLTQTTMQMQPATIITVLDIRETVLLYSAFVGHMKVSFARATSETEHFRGIFFTGSFEKRSIINHSPLSFPVLEILKWKTGGRESEIKKIK